MKVFSIPRKLTYPPEMFVGSVHRCANNKLYERKLLIAPKYGLFKLNKQVLLLIRFSESQFPQQCCNKREPFVDESFDLINTKRSKRSKREHTHTQRE